MALAKDRDTLYKEGVDEELPVAASTQIFGGSLVCSNATGYCVPGSDVNAYFFQGVALAEADNSAVATDGYINVKLRRKGVFRFAASGMTQADIGKDVYISDDQTVVLDSGSTNLVKVGVIAKVDSATVVWVDISMR